MENLEYERIPKEEDQPEIPKIDTKDINNKEKKRAEAIANLEEHLEKTLGENAAPEEDSKKEAA